MQWRAVDICVVLVGVAVGMTLLLHFWCRRCSAAHVHALRSDDDLGLRGRWQRWRRDNRALYQYSRLPL